MAVSRRKALGLLAAAGAELTGLLRSSGKPDPGPAPGVVRKREAYGDLPRQFGDWWVPVRGKKKPLPTVVLVHGGYWRDRFDLSLEDAVAAHLSARGFLVWNVEYRPSSVAYPATLIDAALAYDHLATGRYAHRVDSCRLAVVGHSAGGHLALWLASRHRLPSGSPGRPVSPTVPPPTLVVAQAPVAGLVEAFRLGLGDGAVQALLDGTPETVPQRYAAADPTALLPTGVPTVLVHSREDDRVPFTQSTDYVAAATAAGDDSRLVVVTGDHFAHLDPDSQAVSAMVAALKEGL